MPLTEESFRGPPRGKGLFLRALSTFYLEGRGPSEVGEVFFAPIGLAAILLHSGKAEKAEGPARPAPKQTPGEEPASDALTFAPGEVSTKQAEDQAAAEAAAAAAAKPRGKDK